MGLQRWQVPFVVGSVGRLAYGLGAILAPERMSGTFAPTLRGHPDPRMNLRGFGGAQSAIALHTLTGLRDPAQAGDLLRLNALTDGLDCFVSLLEYRDRGKVDRMVAGGVGVNVAGLVCWTAAGLLLARRQR